jgi:hypothetical protein
MSGLMKLLSKTIVLQKEVDATVKWYNDIYFSLSNSKEIVDTVSTLRNMAAISRKNQIQLTLVVYPLLYKSHSGEYPFENIHSFIMHSCEEGGLHCIDGYEAFRKYSDLQKFTIHDVDFHPNGEANRVLVDFLHRQGTLKF